MYPKDRRVQIVNVPERLLIDLFRGPGQCVAVRLNHPKLPEDTEIVGVRHDWERMGLALMVHSASFRPVPEGMPAPYFDCGGIVADYVLRYIDGDRIVEQKPLDLQRQEAEVEAKFLRMNPPRSIADVCNTFRLPSKLLEATEVRDLTDEERACNERSKAEQFRAIAGSKPETAWENIVVNAQPAEESSREWFQREMSRTD